MSKPIALVDMDGVIADFDGWIFDRRYLWPSLTIKPGDQTDYYLTSHVNLRDGKAMRQHVNESRIFRELDVIDGAVAGLWALAEEMDVWICTRPLEANVNCLDDKRWWLKQHFGEEFARKMIPTSDKSMVRARILLDDAPKRSEVLRAMWTPIVYTQPANRDLTYPRFTWADPLDNILRYAGA